MRMRLCSTCGAIVPMKTMSTDGYDWWCKTCMDTAYTTSGYIDEPTRTVKGTP